jgi:hypothetical protein
MKTLPKEKPRIVPVTDPDEIASIQCNGAGDIYGGWEDDILHGRTYWAYAHSLERWRKRSREGEKHGNA